MPTSDSASNATPSTSSATPSATPRNPSPDPTTATTHRFLQHPSADVAVNYCRQGGKKPHQNTFWWGFLLVKELFSRRQNTGTRADGSPVQPPLPRGL